MLTDEQFLACSRAAEFLESGDENSAREEVIRVLASLPDDSDYGELVNTLVRRSGLFPYVQQDSASWQDRFACEAFKVDGGADIPVTLHREQSVILKRLLEGDSLAVSAPTSFGKSFIIDAFIAIKRPSTVVVIVPTIALADETRRRLQGKFGVDYKVITTGGVELSKKSLLVFPAERAMGYVDSLQSIDLLVVDEFYKADNHFDPDRSPALLRAILRLSPLAKQRYFLAPNISALSVNEFTSGMDFLPLDFQTVLLEIDRAYLKIGRNEKAKEEYLLRLLREAQDRTLIYAGTYSAINEVSRLLISSGQGVGTPLLRSFARWLETHYGKEWDLPKLVTLGTGVHSGKLHRFLAQVQVALFENDDGLQNIISTSSIVEGVNTRAKNIIIWKSKNGRANLKHFTYRNIIGRGGRAFKHFIGNIYLLDKPPPEEAATIDLEMSDDVLSGEPERHSVSVTAKKEQIARIAAYKIEMRGLLGADSYDEAIRSGRFISTDKELLRSIAISVKDRAWNGIGFLNSNNADNWDKFLFSAIKLQNSDWETRFTVIVNFVKALRHNWNRSIPEIISALGGSVSIDQFFALERNATFRLSSILSDVNTINRMVHNDAVDISPFLSKLSNAFLPPTVFELEEYGLPRMISRKIHDAGVLDFTAPQITLHSALSRLNEIKLSGLKDSVENLTQFDEFILQHFLNGIRTRPKAS